MTESKIENYVQCMTQAVESRFKNGGKARKTSHLSSHLSCTNTGESFQSSAEEKSSSKVSARARLDDHILDEIQSQTSMKN